jgi:hypothetical protein
MALALTLWGIPKHLWRMLTNLTDAGAGLILWRVMLVAVAAFGLFIIAATGSIGTVGAIILGFIITTLLSKILADDILAIWRNLWNAEWAEVEV